MRFGYNILFAFFFFLSAPFYFWKMWRRGNWRAGFGQRFGFYSPQFKASVNGSPLIWLHAVSVGEVGICCQLLHSLEPCLRGRQILVSTTTSTGMAELQRLLPPHILRIYYPADFAGAVRRAMKLFRPAAIILVEAELWPNFLWEATGRKVPLFLVNARFSKKSFRNYTRAGFLVRPIFARFAGVGCQYAEDLERVKELGFPPAAVRLTGNLKFDAALPNARGALDARALLRQIGVADDAPLLVAGSTHAGEEAILAEVLTRLRKQFPKLFLVLVPRHFERTKDVAKELEVRGVKFILRSALAEQNFKPSGPVECLLVNSTGELKFFYEVATVVFVGKSLTARGGQNPIEPAALGKPVVFGPQMQNFASAVRAFKANDAIVQVPDAPGLEKAVAELLTNEARRNELGQRARQVVEQNLGATERTVALIVEGLGKAPPASQI
jgi:3-deoxy-D-manno-octulosonic-acid transferase